MTSGAISKSPPDSGERLAYVALARLPGMGARRLAQVLSRYGSATDVVRARSRTAELTPLVSRAVAHEIARIDLDRTSAEIAGQERRGNGILVPMDLTFPASLRVIPDPPVLLWFRGDLASLRYPAVGIVGSRKHTAYGAEVARVMARAAAVAGIVVVSGMARGLDAVAHAAALDGGFLTVGVLGSGVDVVYPVANQALFERVPRSGLLLTEHAPGEGIHAGAFPRRNRLISGLAKVLIVVEAAHGSGTLLTVTSALEQGKDVLAVPGSIFSETSRGTNRLIQDGATPLLGADQFLELYGVAGARPASSPAPTIASPPCTLSPTEARVFEAVCDGGRHVDEIALTAGLPIGELLATLLGLELGGHVDQLPGNIYRRRAA